MIENYPPLVQTLMGTGLTWLVTAIGSIFCALHSTTRNHKTQVLILDGSLGFSAGVMLAASFWSLLEPALEMAKSELEWGSLAVFPVVSGLIFGALFVGCSEYYLPAQWFDEDSNDQIRSHISKKEIYEPNAGTRPNETGYLRFRSKNQTSFELEPSAIPLPRVVEPQTRMTHRLWLLLIAITVHNIPEGLAVGIAFGGIGHYNQSTFVHARNLAVGIAIQNFPEGLAVSLPLHAAGYGFLKSFWYGQFSGLVEPLAGVIGCLAVQFFRQLQPYALGFAAGAMIFVVFDDIIPEAQSRNNGHFASMLGMTGFIFMMMLDVITGT